MSTLRGESPTYRRAVKTVNALLETGADTDRVKAQHGLIAAQIWLRHEITTGRKSRRADRAARLEQVQLQLAQINKLLDLPEFLRHQMNPSPRRARG